MISMFRAVMGPMIQFIRGSISSVNTQKKAVTTAAAQIISTFRSATRWLRSVARFSCGMGFLSASFPRMGGTPL